MGTCSIDNLPIRVKYTDKKYYRTRASVYYYCCSNSSMGSQNASLITIVLPIVLVIKRSCLTVANNYFTNECPTASCDFPTWNARSTFDFCFWVKKENTAMKPDVKVEKLISDNVMKQVNSFSQMKNLSIHPSNTKLISFCSVAKCICWSFIPFWTPYYSKQGLLMLQVISRPTDC